MIASSNFRYRVRSPTRDKMRFIIGLGFGLLILSISSVVPGQIVVSTTGCANVNVACTMEELHQGGTITINDVIFYHFEAYEFDLGGIVVTPFGSDHTVGLDMQPADPEANPWLIEGDTSMFLFGLIEYDVAVLAGDEIDTSVLLTSFGTFNDTGTSFIDGVVRKTIDGPDISTHEIEISCNDLDPLNCGDMTGIDSVEFDPVNSLEILKTIDLGFGVITGGGGAIEVTRVANEFRRLQAADIQVISDSTWKSSDTFEPGWASVNFDDNAWPDARAPYPSDISPTDLVPGTTAQFMWHDPAGTSDGETGVIEAFMRASFGVDLITINAPFQAIAEISVDDDYDLYVNDELVFENHDEGNGNQVDTINIAPFLHDGANVIGIHSVDGGWAAPYDRGYERALVDVAILSLPYINVPILTGSSSAGEQENLNTLELDSGSEWLSSAVEEDNWHTLEFDDSTWPPARVPYPGLAASTLIPDTAAQAIWHDPDMIYNGTNGPIHAYFRYNFDIPTDLLALPIMGQLRINADDDYDVYVNGTLVHENHDNGFSTLVDLVDISDELQEGPNVIAIHAVDGGWSDPRDRGSERLIVDGLIASGDADFDADADGDGFVDLADNCTLHANSGQSDTNGDGYGNACDPDLNGDLIVNILDLGLVKDVFFSTNIVSDADFNNDTNINLPDLAIISDFFFGSPGPSALATTGLLFVDETGNTRTSAFNASRLFGLEFDADIFDSKTVPHASFVAEIDSPDDIDWYSFTVLSGGTIFLDVDAGWDPGWPQTSVETLLHLFDSAGTLLAWSNGTSGDPGSAADGLNNTLDPFIGVYAPVAAPGVYYVAVSGSPNYATETIVSCDPGVLLTRPDAASTGGYACLASAPGDDSFVGGSSDTGSYILHISNSQPPSAPARNEPGGSAFEIAW